MAHDTQTPLRMAEAQKPYTTPLAPTHERPELAVVLLICRPGSTEPDLVAAWIRTVGPWYCADCSPELAWMRKTDVKASWVRLAEEGYAWEKIECEIRPLDVAKSYRKAGRNSKTKL
jgi:hypothetical protein